MDPPASLPSGTVTFLLTDIEGSTKLWEQHPQAMEAALARHDALAAALIPQHHGTLVKHRGEGDSLFAVFPRAADAVAAATALQRALAAVWAEGREMTLQQAVCVTAVERTPVGSTSERRRPLHPEIKLSSPVRSGGGAMSSELIEGSERETYVALDTFLDDEPRDGLRDARPTVTEFLRSSYSSRGSNDPPGSAGKPRTGRRGTGHRRDRDRQVRAMRTAAAILNLIRERGQRGLPIEDAYRLHDNRFLRLLEELLNAGYLEDWKLNNTPSGVPQGGVISPILSNLVLDRLDQYVEQHLLPEHTRGQRRRTNPPYVRLTKAASKARKEGDRETARKLNQQAQSIPSRDPEDPNFRRLWYVRYADDFLLGFVGPKSEAVKIKQKIATFLRDDLKLELSDEKTLVTHAREGRAKFLGYEVHVLHADDQHDHRGPRCINGSIGLRVPLHVRKAHCAPYLRRSAPIHLPQRRNDDVYSIVAQYQAEYRGVVQYYRLAYNLHTLGHLKRVMELSLVKTLADKFQTTCQKTYAQYQTTLETEEGRYKVLLVQVERDPPKQPLTAYFGGVSLRWNQWVAIQDDPTSVWNGRSEVVERLLAQECELCGSEDRIEVHHIRKLADLERKDSSERPEWVRKMAARHRKTLVVCHDCHGKIQYGRYDGKALPRSDGWRAP